MGYKLGQAKTDLKRSLLWNEQRLSRAPLSGDPYGVTFYTEIYPIVVGSLSASSLYYANGTTASGLFVSVDEDTGLILTSGSPTSGLYANFNVSEISDTQLTGVVLAGLDYLETFYPRGFNYTTASDVSTEEIVNTSGSDPTLGSGLLFSQSRSQIGLYLLACQVKLAEALHQYASTHAFSYRGAGGGVLVDKSRQPDQVKRLVDNLKTDFQLALQTQIVNDAEGGFFVQDVRSLDYWINFSWQTIAQFSPLNLTRGISG